MSKHPFILKLGAFLHQSPGYSREFPFEHAKFQFSDEFSVKDLKGTVVVTRSQQGILVQGNFNGELELDCVRCLKEYNYSLAWDFDELYFFNKRDASKEDLILPDNAQIDIKRIILEEALLVIPYSPTCKEGCEGLCQVCGTDLNFGDCGHDELPPQEGTDEEEHSPFAGLKDLLGE
ncbi:MAG: DUF177 domain-containing protein [Anaerolineae bacterium]|jgi:uncharacterized protein|nr:DUF177 domain-containing protein [Anaerolineae bacterium]MBT7188881.1 DUF177 domain-containing protein [Anaerolineae bacterium]MBT7783022.1 DUF177 domain-containing protein [Anaerolineae bacterium]